LGRRHKNVYRSALLDLSLQRAGRGVCKRQRDIRGRVRVVGCNFLRDVGQACRRGNGQLNLWSGPGKRRAPPKTGPRRTQRERRAEEAGAAKKRRTLGASGKNQAENKKQAKIFFIVVSPQQFRQFY
jgi:hypothetical protein